ncbi:MAG: hypothetical protein ACKOA9_02405 [Actinomycetota bacterium]
MSGTPNDSGAHRRLGPTTRMGQVALGCIGLFVVALVVVAVAASGPDPSWIRAVTVIEVAAAAGALTTGVLAIARHGERAVSVIIATTVGAIVVVFALVDLAFLA